MSQNEDNEGRCCLAHRKEVTSALILMGVVMVFFGSCMAYLLHTERLSWTVSVSIGGTVIVAGVVCALLPMIIFECILDREQEEEVIYQQTTQTPQPPP